MGDHQGRSFRQPKATDLGDPGKIPWRYLDGNRLLIPTKCHSPEKWKHSGGFSFPTCLSHNHTITWMNLQNIKPHLRSPMNVKWYIIDMKCLERLRISSTVNVCKRNICTDRKIKVAYGWEWRQQLAANRHKGTTWAAGKAIRLDCGQSHPTL